MVEVEEVRSSEIKEQDNLKRRKIDGGDSTEIGEVKEEDDDRKKEKEIKEDEDLERRKMIDDIVKKHRDNNAPESFISNLIRALTTPHAYSDSEDDEDPALWEEYHKQIDDTEGFGVKLDLGCRDFVTLRPLIHFKESESHWKIITKLTNEAIEEYNKNNMGKEFKVVDVEWVVTGPDCGILYYITFKAEDSQDGVKTFEAKVLCGIGRNIVDLCRMKKQTDA